MTFLNPLVLFGLIAAAAPILIHLLQLRRLRQVEFSSVRFLKQIQHASARRVRLRDYLLMLIRALAIASLVCAFARPALKGFATGSSRNAAVIIIDDSPSTLARNEYGEVSSQIRSVASSILGSFHQGDNVSLIFTSNPSDSSRPLTSIDPGTLLPQIARSEPSNIRGSYDAAIYAALAKLSQSGYISKEIYLVGDLQRTEFGQNAGDLHPNTRIFFLGTESSSGDNLSVSGAKLANPVVEMNAPAAINATLTNDDGSDKPGVVVSLYLDGRKVAQSVADVPAGESREVNLAFTVTTSGFHAAVIRIDDNSLQSDNSCRLSFFAIRKLNVIVLKRDSTGSTGDFVITAAHAVQDTSVEINVRTMTPERFVYTDLSSTDVVVAEAYAAGQDFDSKIIRFVKEGGGAVLISPSGGDMRAFGELLAGMEVGSAVRMFSSSVGTFRSIDRIDAGDDFFSGIFTSRQSAEQIKNQLLVKIRAGAEIQANPFAHVLMSTPESSFFLGREVGSGFAFVIASPADTVSSTFTMSPLFPVIIQRTLFYSASVRNKPISAFPGDSVSFAYPAGGLKTATLISPNGTQTKILPEYVGGTARFRLDNLNDPGTYTLTGGDTLCQVSVNIDPRESDLTPATHDEIQSFAKRLGFDRNDVFIVKADKNVVRTIDALRRGKDLSSFFAGFTLLLLVAEIFVSRMKTF